MMNQLTAKGIMALVAVLFVSFSCPSLDAAILSSTQGQAGDFASIKSPLNVPTGKIVKIGTFSFLPTGYDTFASVKLFASVRSAGLNALVAPRLYFTGPNILPVFFPFVNSAEKVQTDLIVMNTTTQPVVEHVESLWVPLTTTQGASLASLINLHAGTINAWLYSDLNPEFHAPNKTITFIQPFPTTAEEKYFATLQLTVVPEPTSAVLLLGLLFGAIPLLRGFGFLKWSTT
jgi:hypothetical protein